MDNETRRNRTPWVASLAGALALTTFAPMSHAALGDAAASVSRDGQLMSADPSTTTTMPLYDRHELRSPDGATVHEYATRDASGGTVFAVNFDGPSMPDMKALLGANYDQYVSAAAKARGRNHHVMSFASDGLVVTIVKQPRGFQGEAHLPALMPQGVRVEDLR